MLIRIRFNGTEVSILFAFGFLVGASIEIISKLYEAQSRALQSTGGGGNTTSAELFHSVKILCLVLTTQSKHASRAIHVKNTWGRRCNKLIFVSNVTDVELGSVSLHGSDNYTILWGKTKRTFIYAYEHFYDDYDWFYKADDDTFAIMDNMRYALSAYSTDDPIYFGQKLKFSEKFGYFAGGSGYVMGKRALKMLVTEALPNDKLCRQSDIGHEDWEMGICMNNIGVYAGDARDRFKRDTFFSHTPEVHLFSMHYDWYWERLFYPNNEGLDCCSNYTIAFHYIRDSMYLNEYLVSNLQAYGVRHVYDPMPPKANFTIVVQTLNTEVRGQHYRNLYE